ncbi:MAG: type secretion system secreted protein VgrG [Verrucomicrobiota bacterium]|jgi:type VI secretion system secreted protein VgrG
MNYRINALRLGLVLRSFLAVTALSTLATHAQAQSLGSAENFAVLGASTVTNTGASHFDSSVGVSPGSAITGFPPGIIINGGLHAADPTATQAHADYAAAYTAFAGLVSPPANDLTGADLGGKTLTPGVYRYATSATSNGLLTFDAQNDPSARFVIQIGTTLITSSSSSVSLINGADARNVYFQVGTSATLGSGSTFIGNILAYASVTTVSGTTVTGRLLALTGAVTLDTNNVTSPGLTPAASPTPTPSPAQLLNISTRLNVQTDENVAIGGFIITGNAPKKVIVRGIGPSLTGLSPLLSDPVLELHGADGSLITTNDNWKDTQQTEIQNSTLAPTNDSESAIVATLAPANYTAVLRGKNGTTGIGLVEMYDLDLATDSKLANISTRGLVQADGNVMIAGFILGNGNASEKVIVRGIGPSLAGIANVLADPTLELHNVNGTLLISDDNWKDDVSQAALITATGMPPQNDLESAVVIILPPGQYTAILSGKNSGTGVAVAEVYHLL